MPSCAAFGCNNRSSKPHKSTKQNKKEVAPKLTFHKFPQNPERRKAWADALRRVEWIPNNNSVLCSTHFTEDAFDRTSLSCVRLRETAVPSIFPAFPAHFQDVDKAGESTSPSATPLEEVNTVDVDALSSATSALPDPLSSLPAVSSTSLRRRTRRVISKTSFPPLRRMRRSSVEIVLRQQLKQMKLRYQSRIKLLQQSERRHVKTIASLRNALTALRKQNFNQG